jgi:hypothetical protein
LALVVPHHQYRTREYLTEKEVERLLKTAGRNRHRDATMILLALRYGLRASDTRLGVRTRPACLVLSYLLTEIGVRSRPPRQELAARISAAGS